MAAGGGGPVLGAKLDGVLSASLFCNVHPQTGVVSRGWKVTRLDFVCLVSFIEDPRPSRLPKGVANDTVPVASDVAGVSRKVVRPVKQKNTARLALCTSRSCIIGSASYYVSHPALLPASIHSPNGEPILVCNGLSAGGFFSWRVVWPYLRRPTCISSGGHEHGPVM
jgi:hypothetical protein